MSVLSKKLNVLDLFAGCGGLSYGFHKNGFNVVAANELEEQIGKTYKANYPETNVIIGNIVNEEIKQKIYDNFNEVPCDIVIGGPPCVAYSMSGNRDSRDERGMLFKDYISIVNTLKPKLFIMENVKGILTMKQDKDDMNPDEKELAEKYYKLEKKHIELLNIKKHKTSDEINKEIKTIKSEMNKIDTNKFRILVPEKIADKFEKMGYTVKKKLLNSANFGVPQKRERVIFIGMRKDIECEIEFPKETHTKETHVSVFDAIDDLKNLPENKELSHIFTKHSDAFIERLKNTKNGESPQKKYSEAYFRVFKDKPSNTVKENHGGVFVHYEQHRVMTPRELARLQSFPDTFKFLGTKSCILKQIGNAVPCGLSEALAKQVKKMLV